MQDSLARVLALQLKNSKADLVGGKVPASQLPAYVDTIIEVETYEDLPQPGSAGVIYIVKTPSRVTYRWTGSSYLLIDEKSTYYSVKVSSTDITTMAALREYVANVNATGLHCFFDFSEFIDNAYVCLVLMFAKDDINFCLIFDQLNGKKYIDYYGYEDDELVSSYINRLGDDVPTCIHISDDEMKVSEIEEMLTEINTIDHHVLFDLSVIKDGCYLATISLDILNSSIILHDLTSGKIARMTYNEDTLLSSVLDGLSDVVDTGSEQTITGKKTLTAGLYIGSSSQGSYVNLDGSNVLTFGTFGNDRWKMTAQEFYPTVDNSRRIGTSARRIKDIFLSNVLSDGTNKATVKEIADGIVNVINASDIAGTTLTEAQIDIIKNGKETQIKDRLSGFGNIGVKLFPPEEYDTATHSLRGYYIIYGSDPKLGLYNINGNTRILTFSSSKYIQLNNINTINGTSVTNIIAGLITAEERAKLGRALVTHVINVAASTSQGTYRYQFQVSAPETTTFTQLTQIANYLYTKKPNLRLNVSGTYTENSDVYLIVGLEAISSSQVRLEMYKAYDGTYKAMDTGVIEVVDTIM